MIQQTAADLGAYLAPLIAAAYPDMPVMWDNDGTQHPPKDKPFVRVKINPASETQAALGNRLWMHTGVVIIQICVPVGTGDGPANRMADQFKAWLRGKSVGAVQFGAVYLTAQGLREAFYQINVNAEYTRHGA